MRKIGVSLVLQKTGAELMSWPTLPREITYKDDVRTGAIVGAEIGGDALLVERFATDDAPFADPAVVDESASFDGKCVVVKRTYAAPDYGPVRAALIAGIKSEASNRITAYCPQYKQANLTAQAAELALVFPATAGDDLPEPYRSAWIIGRAIWDNIKTVRDHSNKLEAEVNATPDDGLQAWQQHDWPILK